MKELKSILIILIFFILSALVFYYDYLTLEKVFYFYDVGADTWNLFYPNLVNEQRIAQENGIFTWWSLTNALGEPFAPKLFLEPTTLILYLIPGSYKYTFHLFYFLILLPIAIFTYFFLKQFLSNENLSIIGALLWAFSGYILIATTWYTYPKLFLGFTVLLYAMEKYLNKEKINFWIFYGFYLISYNIYFAFVWGSFIAIFYLIRKIEKDQVFNFKAIFNFFKKLLLPFIIAVFLASLTMFPYWHLMFSSPRSDMITNIKYFLLRPFLLADTKYYLTEFLRLFGNNTIGSAVEFNGWGNYLESPDFYVGILLLLTIPSFFKYHKKDLSYRLYLFFGAYLAIAALVPFFLETINLFSKNYFRPNFNLFASFYLFFIGIRGLDYKFLKKENNNPVVYWLLLGGIFIISSLIMKQFNLHIIIALIFFTSYSFLMVKNLQKLYIFLILIFLEVNILSGSAFRERKAFEYDQLIKYDLIYKKDKFYKAVNYIKQVDTSFYRIEQATTNFLINRPQVLNYYGTTVYQSFNLKRLIKLYQYLGLAGHHSISYRWLRGTLKNPIAAEILGVKYFVADSVYYKKLKKQFASIKQINDLYILKNKNAYPLIYTYKLADCVSEKTVINLSTKALISLLSNKVVIDNNICNHSYIALDTIVKNTPEVPKHKILEVSNKIIRVEVNIPTPSYVVFNIPYDRFWIVKVNNQVVSHFPANIAFIGIRLDNPGSYLLELAYKPYYIWLYKRLIVKS